MLYGEPLAGWESDVLRGMQSITVGIPYGGKLLTSRQVDNLHRRYIALVTGGAALPRYDTAGGDAAARSMMLALSKDTGYSTAIARAFLVTLYGLQKSGRIPEAKYDPVGARVRAAARDKVDPSAWSSVKSGVGAVGGIMGRLGVGLLVLAGLGAAMYFRLGRK